MTTSSTRFSTEQAAEYLSLPAATLRWYRHAGIGPKSYKLGRRLFYDLPDLIEWEQSQRAMSTVGGVR
jgi:hypothetical protein